MSQESIEKSELFGNFRVPDVKKNKRHCWVNYEDIVAQEYRRATANATDGGSILTRSMLDLMSR